MFCRESSDGTLIAEDEDRRRLLRADGTWPCARRARRCCRQRQSVVAIPSHRRVRQNPRTLEDSAASYLNFDRCGMKTTACSGHGVRSIARCKNTRPTICSSWAIRFATDEHSGAQRRSPASPVSKRNSRVYFMSPDSAPGIFPPPHAYALGAKINSLAGA